MPRPAIRIHTGDKFGRLVIVKELPSKSGSRQVECICDCGIVKRIALSGLVHGKVRSCGCRHIERITIHGHTAQRKRSPEHRTWVSIKQRCFCRTSASWERYGGRGITVCERWSNSFPDFLADVGKRPSSQHSLDRFPDNNGDYKPGNVRWATRSEQQRNKRSNVWINHEGIKRLLIDVAEELGLDKRQTSTLRRRRKEGVQGSELLDPRNRHLHLIAFDGRSQSLTSWANELGIKPITLSGRLRRGWPVERALGDLRLILRRESSGGGA